MTSMVLARTLANSRPLFALPDAEPRLDIRDERASDIPAREALLDAAMGPARFEKTSERLRESRAPANGCAVVAMDGARLVGTLRLWHVHAGPGRPALLLGPLAVADSHRCHGLGSKLMAEALFRALCRGHQAVLLVGDAPYYERFGFSARLTAGLELPGPVDRARFLGLELEPGALEGASGMVVATGPRAAMPVMAESDMQVMLRAA